MANIFTLDTNTTKPKHVVSFSQYSIYSQCPKHWELSYIRKERIPSTGIDAIFGTAVHTTIQTWLDVVFNKSIKESEELNLALMLENEMKKEYVKEREKIGSDFSTPKQLGEYLVSGIEILRHVRSNRTKYFPSKDCELVGCEVPLRTQAHPNIPGIQLWGYLDLVIHFTKLGRYKIIDIKTSRNGWKDSKKKDKVSTSQLVLYKEYFAEKWDIDPKKIDIEYFIVKRQIYTESLFPQKRVQHFAPANGSVSLKKVRKSFERFIEECFNPDGSYNTNREYLAIKGKGSCNCKYCPFIDRDDLCPKKNRLVSPPNKVS